MARDWNELSTMVSLEERVASRAPGNTAEFPISIIRQQDDLDRWVWVIDIHVRIPGVTEYEVTASDPSYPAALRKAYLGLNNEGNLRRNADAANAAFGVRV